MDEETRLHKDRGHGHTRNHRSQWCQDGSSLDKQRAVRSWILAQNLNLEKDTYFRDTLLPGLVHTPPWWTRDTQIVDWLWGRRLGPHNSVGHMYPQRLGSKRLVLQSWKSHMESLRIVRVSDSTRF